MGLLNRLCAITALTTCWIGAIEAETLGSVLAAHQVPATGLSDVERQQAITSFAVSTDGSIFLLAYFDDDGSITLPPLLHVFRFDRTNGRSKRAALRGQEVSPDRVMDKLPGVCLGSALSISEENGLIAIDTHINPSAGCVLLLSPDLEWNAALPGSLSGRLGNRFIVAGNSIHFAPTHPGTLGVFDPAWKQLTPIYPAAGDERRIAFSKLLQAHLPSSAWCREFNNACDPENFTTDILNVKVDVPRNAFSFDAAMRPQGFGKDAEAAIPPQTVHYECTFRNGAWALTSK